MAKLKKHVWFTYIVIVSAPLSEHCWNVKPKALPKLEFGCQAYKFRLLNVLLVQGNSKAKTAFG